MVTSKDLQSQGLKMNTLQHCHKRLAALVTYLSVHILVRIELCMIAKVDVIKHCAMLRALCTASNGAMLNGRQHTN